MFKYITMTTGQIQEFKHSELVHAVAIHSKIPYEQLLEWSESELRYELYQRHGHQWTN